MRLITHGITRLVILTDKYAIKIPKPRVWNHFLRGLLASMEERLIWEIACIDDKVNNHLWDCKEHLCPVVWCSWGGWILVMKRAEELDPDEHWEKIQVLEKLCGDHKRDNYGKIDGKLVMFDYGESSGFAHNT